MSSADDEKIVERVGQAIGGGSASDGYEGTVLGLLVWWGQFLTRITPDELRALCVAEGVDTTLLPPVPDHEKAFRRAAKAAQGCSEDDLDGDGGEDKIRVDFVYRDAVEITYGIQAPVWDKEHRRKDWRQYAKVTWLPLAGRVVSDKPSDPYVKKVIEGLPVYLAHYVTADINKLIGAVMRKAGSVQMVTATSQHRGKRRGVKLNSRFVPAATQGSVKALARVLGQVEGCGMDIVVVPDDKDGLSRATMGRAAQHGLDEQLCKAEEELSRFRQKLEGGGLVRSSTLLSRVEDLAALEEQAEALASSLRFKADEIVGRIDAARQGLAGLM